MPACILHNAFLPSVLDEVFSELDDALDQIPLRRREEKTLDDALDQIVGLPACSPPKRRRENQAVMGQLGKVTDDESKLTIALNVSKFKPDELKVNVDGRTLTVEGKQEVKDGSNYTARSFLRQWTLPENIDVEQIRSSLSDEGQLAIELPKPKETSNARNIPILKATSQS
ncbi:Hsp20/alpha crystallin family protein [Cooperia oncophora]